MRVIADLQLHSRFSRAVSNQMTLPNIAAWAKRKGIGLVATGDWTHPIWFREIERDLEEMGNGLLRLKADALGGSSFAHSVPSTNAQGKQGVYSESSEGLEKARLPASTSSSPLFLLATEVSCIYSQGGKVRRIHTLIWVPTLESARKISQEMTKRGCNLMSDGRPIVGLTSIQIAELVLSIEPKALIIPAHAWTPWFSVYGALGGFDSLDEAFGPYAKNIYAVETGLSSSPAMNWRIKELDNRSIVSFSDAHSGPKLGREATVFNLPELSYNSVYQAIQTAGALGSSPFAHSVKVQTSPSPLPQGAKAVTELEKTRFPAPFIAYTIEFYPEEGKYHYTGHRVCNIRLSPDETKKKGTTCPVCGKPLTQGVMQRVEQLASRSEAELKLSNYPINKLSNIKATGSEAFPNRPPFVSLVPLQEILSEAIGSPVASPKVQQPYMQLTDAFGGEFSVLLTAETDAIAKSFGPRVAQAIDKVRRGEIVIDPGYDGVFGVVKIWKEGEEEIVDKGKEQLAMF